MLEFENERRKEGRKEGINLLRNTVKAIENIQ
jgi:hypothetical protein